ncbi:hypothetical protein BCEP4_2320013 [Burkholderia cepacia]|nr:hypothetical protein BCEP4_2320013 [Burkholderia cepacia]
MRSSVRSAASCSRLRPAGPRLRPRRSRNVRWSSFPLHHQRAIAPGGQIDIGPGRARRLLPEAVKHVDGVGEGRDVNDPECAARFAQANFPHADADGAHRLPVVRRQAALHLVDLVAGFASRGQRKTAKIGEGAADENNRLRRKNGRIIQNFVWVWRVLNEGRAGHAARESTVTIRGKPWPVCRTGRSADAWLARGGLPSAVGASRHRQRMRAAYPAPDFTRPPAVKCRAETSFAILSDRSDDAFESLMP